MEEDTRGLYFWPVRPDTSFEEIRVLKQRVDLELILDQSTQHRQCYRIVFQFHFDHVRGDRGVWVGGLSMVLLFCLMFWFGASKDFAVVFDFILVMWIWYSQLCCCFWFYSGHVNLIFTALLLLLNFHFDHTSLIFTATQFASSIFILFWSCESDIHSFAVVYYFILVMWIWYSQLCCCFNIFLVMWTWCSQLCCCFWFYSGHVNVIFTALLFF